jgi:hypothetical protein
VCDDIVDTRFPTAAAELPGKHFLRFHKPLHDAVRSGRISAIVNVLVRAQLPGDLARRTAEKILRHRRSQRQRTR